MTLNRVSPNLWSETAIGKYTQVNAVIIKPNQKPRDCIKETDCDQLVVETFPRRTDLRLIIVRSMVYPFQIIYEVKSENYFKSEPSTLLLKVTVLVLKLRRKRTCFGLLIETMTVGRIPVSKDCFDVACVVRLYPRSIT